MLIRHDEIPLDVVEKGPASINAFMCGALLMVFSWGERLPPIEPGDHNDDPRALLTPRWMLERRTWESIKGPQCRN